MDLGVTVFTKNEENLIVPCVSALQKVFPQVEVIDLGSTDTTLDRLDYLGCKVRQIECSPEMYPYLKNSIGKEHSWAFFVDSDEIYPEEQLLKIVPLIESRQYRGYRISWRFVYEDSKGKYVAKNLASNVVKIFRSDRFTWVNPWPCEALENRKREKIQPRKDLDVWCWHGRLLTRTSIVDEAREQKNDNIKYHIDHYDLKWEKVEEFSWI